MREIKYIKPTINNRVGAFCFDYFLVLIVLFISLFMPFNIYLELLTILLTYTLITIGSHILHKGQSIGKKISNIKVVNNDNTEVSLCKYMVRSYFIFILVVITVGIYPLINSFMLSSREQKTIHDKIFNTKVIRTKSLIV